MTGIESDLAQRRAPQSSMTAWEPSSARARASTADSPGPSLQAVIAGGTVGLETTVSPSARSMACTVGSSSPWPRISSITASGTATSLAPSRNICQEVLPDQEHQR